MLKVVVIFGGLFIQVFYPDFMIVHLLMVGEQINYYLYH